jgi:hypothetical protein
MVVAAPSMDTASDEPAARKRLTALGVTLVIDHLHEKANPKLRAYPKTGLGLPA